MKAKELPLIVPSCCITILSLPLVGVGQETPEQEEEPALRYETVAIDWDYFMYGARLRLPDGQGTVRRNFRGKGREGVKAWPPHETWTIEFLNRGQHLSFEQLRVLCPELKRVGAPGIEITNYWELNDEAVRLIAGVTSLERVILGDTGRFLREEPCPLTVAGLRQLTSLPKLRHLQLEDLEHFTEEDLVATIKAFPRLESIGFADCHVDAKAVRAIAGLESLHNLSLGRCWRVGDDDLRPLARRVELRTLNLQSCGGLTGCFVDHLAELKHLRWLDLGRCWSMEGRVLERLGRFPELEYLDIRYLRGITEKGLRTLSALPRLKTLTVLGCREIDDEALAILSSSESMERILIHKTKVTEAGLRGRQEGCLPDRVVREVVSPAAHSCTLTVSPSATATALVPSSTQSPLSRPASRTTVTFPGAERGRRIGSSLRPWRTSSCQLAFSRPLELHHRTRRRSKPGSSADTTSRRTQLPAAQVSSTSSGISSDRSTRTTSPPEGDVQRSS